MRRAILSSLMYDQTHFCARCGVRVESSSAARTGDGFVCTRCEEEEIQGDLWQQASIKLMGAAASSIPLAAASYLFNPSISGLSGFRGGLYLRGTLMSLAVLMAVGAIGSATRNPEYRALMGPRWYLVYVLSAVGLLLTLGHFVVPLLG